MMCNGLLQLSVHNWNVMTFKDICWFGLVTALRPQTPKHIRGGWSHYTDTSEPVDGGVRTLQL
jgi:hypothetical protein